ncbi:MAG: PASTA domain-containing protein [Flavobacteriales bacterium]|nr:PASTA domain-containing protein [Flavobacteriales bacterium]
MPGRRSLFLLLAPVALAALVVLASWWWMAGYTRHNVQVKVPDLQSMTFEEAVQALEALDLRAEVIDSVYAEEAPKASVVDQDPDSGKFVKPDRTVYLVMNATQPKMLNMPDLVNLSKRQALSVMEILGLKVAAVEYRPDPCMDCVVAQLYKGQAIAPDSRIRKGEAITLVLGQGQHGGEQVPVPDLRGMAYAEMKAVLAMASLNLGLVVEVQGCGNSGCDTALATVVRQFPSPDTEEMISPGGMVDVWLSMDTTSATP